MKRLLLAVVIALTLIVVTVTPALAIDLEVPNGNTIEGLPQQAENATNSGVVIDATPTCPPECSGGF
jgi:hypothetical protein